ncbi:MAG: RNA polymerase sigma factor [Defluviitaleaceae bacterium]|nr:RNA polymerase sigma factor [Defluviitaleaceae bacterium]
MRDIASYFDTIYNDTRKAVLALITAKCATDDIKDIFQETYMALYRTLAERGTDYVKDPQAFVRRIARNKIADHYTWRQRWKMHFSQTAWDENSEADGVGTFGVQDAAAFMTEDFANGLVMIEALRQWLTAKPERVQKTFYLIYEAGLTIPETAKALNQSESNVKNMLYRTLKELRQLLAEEGDIK